MRYNAAKTLVECDRTWEHIEAVLGGYDKFAADAVKYALYKKYDINPNKEAKEILEERHASMEEEAKSGDKLPETPETAQAPAAPGGTARAFSRFGGRFSHRGYTGHTK